MPGSVHMMYVTITLALPHPIAWYAKVALGANQGILHVRVMTNLPPTLMGLTDNF